jgi:hypothetical protein
VKVRRQLVLAVALFLSLGSILIRPAAGQELRGDIVGTARDSSGGVLPGVLVTVTGPTLIIPQTATTLENGDYRFPSLPTGTYSVTFELSGFQTVRHEGIVLTLRRVMTVDATMAPAAITEAIQVVASSATIDVMTTSQGTSFTDEVMSTIPVTRDIWSTMALAAGFQMVSQDVGGSNLGSQTGFSAYGNDQAARTLVEGVIMGDGRAGNSGYFDYGSFDEFELGASGAMGEVAGPGGILNFSVKSGGDSFHGAGLLNYQNDNMRSDNVPEALRVGGGVDKNGFKAPPGGMRVGNNTTSMYDVNGDVGGPIKRQKVWFYFGAREQNVRRTVPGVANFESQTRLRNVSTKVNYAINARNTLIGFYNWREKFDPSSQSATLSAESAVRQQGLADTAKLEWTSVLSGRLFLDVLGGYYYSINKYRSALMNFEEVSSTPVPPGRLEITTGVMSGVGGAATSLTGGVQTPVRKRPQFTASLAYSPSSHNIKVGLQMSQLSDIGDRFHPTDTFYRDERGVPVEVEIWNTPVKADNRNRSIGIYVQDSWQLGRVTLNPAVRYDSYKLGWPDESYTPNQTAFFSPVTAPARTLVNWNNVAPRLGVAWDIGGSGTTVLKAYAGRGYIDVVSSLTVDVNPVSLAYNTYEFRDLNGNRVLDMGTGELGRLLSSGGGGGAVRLDPNIKNPYGDELSVHLEREFFRQSSLRVSYVYKNLRNQDAEVDVARVGAYTVPFSFRDLGPDNVAGTSDDQTIDLFDLRPGVAADRVRTTPGSAVGTPEYNSDFHTLELGFTRRMRDRWMLSVFGGQLWSTKFQNVQTGTGETALVRTAPAFLWLPNQRRFGRLTERTWNVKAIGRYEGPWGISASSTVRLNSGYNWGRRITVNLPQAGRENMLAEPVTSNRGLTTKIVDLRLDKTMSIGGGRNLTAVVDVFNVLNSNTVINFTTISGPSFKQVLGILPPRALRVGLQLKY